MTSLEQGSYYTQEEVEEILDYGFGFRMRGISRVTDDNGDLECIIVFSNEAGPYEDVIDGDRFTYWGELQKGEHNTAPNRGLIRAIAEDIPVHFLHREESGSDLHYLGDVDVVGVEETKDEKGRKRYKFTFEVPRD